MFRQQRQMERWAQRLQAAFQKGELRGYYVPDDIEERRITHKRFLAKPSQITWSEAAVIMRQVLGFNDKSILFAQRSAGVSQGSTQSASCRSISK